MLPEPTTAAGSSSSLEGRRHHHHRHRHHHRKPRAATLGERIAAGFERHRPLLLALMAASGLLGLLLWLYWFAERTSIEQYAGS